MGPVSMTGSHLSVLCILLAANQHSVNNTISCMHGRRCRSLAQRIKAGLQAEEEENPNAGTGVAPPASAPASETMGVAGPPPPAIPSTDTAGEYHTDHQHC